MTPEQIEFFKNILVTIRKDIEPVYRGIDLFTMHEKPHAWPDTLDLVDHGIALLSGDNRPPAQQIVDKVAQPMLEQNTTILLSQEPK